MTDQSRLSSSTALPTPGQLRSVDVFVGGTGGGNPVPFVADASRMTAREMQAIAKSTGHESAFVLAPTVAAADWRLRFFVPQHEMEMCGHATVGTLWALRQWGLWTGPTACVETLSGLVDAEWDAKSERVWISQPTVRIDGLAVEARRRIADVLGMAGDAAPAMTNACTSRVKTLVEMPSVEALDALRPDFPAMEALCASIGSTGLYPFATAPDSSSDAPVVAARQFPKASGYAEDAATGIAAAALWGNLAQTNAIAIGSEKLPVVCTVRQGEAMGRPSAIQVRARFTSTGDTAGCWLSGKVAWGGGK